MPTQYLHALMYAGLAGTALALVVATAQNRWSPRVFFLLALRLAIGWHFLFEGLHKLHSHLNGPSDTVRVFTSEPYFKVAPGPIGEKMRKSFLDPDAVIAAKVKAPDAMPPAEFDKLSAEEQAKHCPPAVAAELDSLVEKAEAAEKDAGEKAIKAAEATISRSGQAKADFEQEKAKAEKAKQEAEKILASATGKDKEAAEKAAKTAGAELARATKGITDAEKAKASAEEAKADALKRRDTASTTAPILVTAAKAKYARWVYGVPHEARDTKLKFTTGDAWFTAPQRLEYLDWLRNQLADAQKRFDAGVGNGTGTDAKRMAEYRTDLIAAEAALVKDTNDFIAELKKDLNGGTAPAEPAPAKSLGHTMDWATMWFLVITGACLMGGLFTRFFCVLATGFLVMTYLAHPPFPWYPLPPNTEGNPVFINKNVIEGLALLTIASFPTGRWLGLDALISRAIGRFCCRRPVSDEPIA